MRGNKILLLASLVAATLATTSCKDESVPKPPAVARDPEPPDGTNEDPPPPIIDAARPVDTRPADAGTADAGKPTDGAPELELEPNPFLGRVAGGTRIKPLFATTPEGGKFFLFEFHDAELKLRCDFQVAGDGQTRCLPTPHPALVHKYNDAACGEPLLPAEEACATDYGNRVVNGRMSIYQLGAAVTPPAVYSMQPDAAGVSRCMPDTTAAGRKYFALGAQVDPAKFALLDSRRPHFLPNRRIHPWVRTTPDGMRERSTWYDSKLGHTCLLDFASDGQRRCLPQASMGMPTNRFADPTCTQFLAATATANPPDSYYVTSANYSACPTKISVLRAEKVPNIATIYVKNATGTCSPAVPSAGISYYLVKAPIPPTEFEAFTETIEGTGRLQQRVLTGIDGAVDRPSTPVDTMFSDSCTFLRTADGKLRCVPLIQTAESYADNLCTKPAAPVSRALCGSKAIHTTFLNSPWCSPIARSYSLGAPVAQAFRKDGSGTCVTIARPNLFEVAATPIEPTTFAEAQEVME